MGMGKPVIVSDCEMQKKIVEESNCGLVFPVGNPKMLAEAILTLYNDKKYARKLGENGRKAVFDRYHWGYDSKVLCNFYNELLKSQ
jgi:glycosyltransferase involved in cell wall biosynthesis